jgi:hypothetical protein
MIVGCMITLGLSGGFIFLVANARAWGALGGGL